jgi:hypothetical protein
MQNNEKKVRIQHAVRDFPCGCRRFTRDTIEPGYRPTTLQSQVEHEDVCSEARLLLYDLGDARLEYTRVANHASRSQDEEQVERVNKDLEAATAVVEEHYKSEPVTRVLRYE